MREIAMLFLVVNLHYAGMIPQSIEIKHAVAQRMPVTISKPKSMASAAFHEVSKTLIMTPAPKTDTLKFFDNVGGK